PASHADPLVYCAKRPHSSKFNPLWDDCDLIIIFPTAPSGKPTFGSGLPLGVVGFPFRYSIFAGRYRYNFWSLQRR
ncbi:MAG: hypothetical protein JW849_11910, partial [Phycisphaerae bacterium]|nr:hypothetical protein [Phycisphaerae bacterium]